VLNVLSLIHRPVCLFIRQSVCTPSIRPGGESGVGAMVAHKYANGGLKV
jgi:hypothetical protein